MEAVAHNLVTLTICFSQRLLRLANISFYTSIYLNLQNLYIVMQYSALSG